MSMKASDGIKENESIIAYLYRSDIVDLTVHDSEMGTGEILISECYYFYNQATLTKEQYIQLAHEILKEAEKL